VSESVRRYASITNNFLHDMATGTWAAALLVILVLHGRLASVPAAAAAALRDANSAVFMLGLIALAVITITGAVRLFYWRTQTPPDELKEKRRALILKHVAFAVVYGGGTFWMWTLLE
jgi:hypothetical protein